jgi:hypothetical protein
MTTGRKRQVSSGYPALINKREARVLEYGAMQRESATYDFDEDGGATGTVSFGTVLPANAVVTNVYAEELTTLTAGAGATLQLQAGAGPTDLTDAEAFDTGFTGADELALASSATAIKLSAASELKMDIATNTITAGKVRFTVAYYVAEEQ